MTAPAAPAPTPNTAEWTEGLRYVARQPILDVRGRVHGYELLFRMGPEAAFRGDGEKATRTMLDNAVMFGMERLTGGLPAFVNCTGRALTEDLVSVLGTTTVLEILETVDPTPELIAICRSLKGKGYRFALDDFVWEPKFEPLMQLADYIKVDFTLTGAEKRRELFRRVDRGSIFMLAEKVETQEEYQQAKDEGFTLFQGYYFCRPLLVQNRKIPANRAVHFEILQLLQSDDVDLHKATRLLKRNPSLTYRLLRLVNSSAYAIRTEIVSIQEALVVVGENTFRRIVTLAIASDLNGDQPLEILRMAFVRARFCELASERCGLDPSEQYLLGMFSMLPGMMLLEMDDLVAELPLRDEIRAALKGAANSERVLLEWLECHERGDWANCDALVEAKGVTEEETVGFYRSALLWASAALGSTG